MLAAERYAYIMETLQRNKIIRISDIAGHFSVSGETVRRDLEALQEAGQVKRIYGGAVLPESPPNVTQYESRSVRSHRQKVAIGKAAAALVKPGETIILGIGTTTLEIARHLKGTDNVTVLTNSLAIVDELSHTGVHVFCLGGRLDSDDLSMSGKLTVNSLQQFFVDRAFFSVGGVTLDGGLSDYNCESAMISQTIIDRADQIVLVADSGKFGSNGFAFICGLEDIDIVISDDSLPEEFQIGLEKRSGLRLILAAPSDEGTAED